MILVFAVLGGVLLGGAGTAYILAGRWKKQTEEVKQALLELSAQHAEEKQQKAELAQKVADLQYQLGEAKKDLEAERKKQA